MRVIATMFMLAAVSTSIIGEGRLPYFDITLRDKVYVEGRTYTLDDIATIDGSDAIQVDRLKHVLVGKAPRAGISASVTRDSIAMRINRLIPGVAKNITWNGATTTRVKGVHYRYDKIAYIKAAKKYLNDWLADSYDEYATIPVGNYDDLQLPKGSVALRAEMATKEKVKKRMCVWIDVIVDQQQYSTLPVWFGVTAKAQVYEFKNGLSAGARLMSGMLYKTKRDLASVSGIPVTDLTLLEGQRLIRRISKGSVLTEEAIEPIPAVEKGQKVSVKASVGKVTLSVTARALEDGNQGESIRVERLDGTDRYMARVTGMGVAVAEGERK